MRLGWTLNSDGNWNVSEQLFPSTKEEMWLAEETSIFWTSRSMQASLGGAHPSLVTSGASTICRGHLARGRPGS